MGSAYTTLTSIDSLRQGDHIAYKTGIFHYQHALVVSINSQKELTVIRFRGSGSHSTGANPRIHSHIREEEVDISDHILRNQVENPLRDIKCIS
jgi:hypothetical protein